MYVIWREMSEAESERERELCGSHSPLARRRGMQTHKQREWRGLGRLDPFSCHSSSSQPPTRTNTPFAEMNAHATPLFAEVTILRSLLARIGMRHTQRPRTSLPAWLCCAISILFIPRSFTLGFCVLLLTIRHAAAGPSLQVMPEFNFSPAPALRAIRGMCPPLDLITTPGRKVYRESEMSPSLLPPSPRASPGLRGLWLLRSRLWI